MSNLHYWVDKNKLKGYIYLNNKVQTTQIYTSGPGELQNAKTCIQCDTLTFVTLRSQILHLE